jgi:arylsulfatase A-like enzyme
MPPNLLLVVMDTARADAFEPWGAPAGATPLIADLARRGTAVPATVAPSNWTLPSHASMFTGLLPSALGLTSGVRMGAPGGMASRALLEANAGRVLAEVLRRRGYTTRGISSNPWIHQVNGFGTGFDVFHSLKGVERKPAGEGLRTRLEWMLDAWRARADDGAQEAGAILRGWMEEGPQPFFWFVNLMECHSPYLPPRPYNDLPGLERIRAARDAARYQTPQGIHKVCVGDLEMPPDTVERTRHLYASAVRQMDDWLAGLIEDLDRRGVLNDTLVVVTSDHGENLGEDGLIGHMFSMSDRLLRVPLVFSTPVATPDGAPATLAQLPQMLAGALGIEDHPWIDDVRPGGMAVSQVAGQILLPERETLARAWGVPDEAIRRIAIPMTAATDGRFKLVRDPAGERLYDLDSDPAESRPIDAAEAGASGSADALRAAIEHADALAPSVQEVAPHEVDDEAAELEERLRQLGYI